MRIIINEELCAGCGVCESLCPDAFQVQDDEKAHLIDADGCNKCDCQEAMDSCPTGAISIQE